MKCRAEVLAIYRLFFRGDETHTTQTVTVRDRDTGQQERIAADRVVAYLTDKLGL